MSRRSIFACVVVVLAMLALAAPALAGGWAVVTLDSLPKDVRAGQTLHLGFMVRQHGKTPTNQDLNGKPLKPVLTARRQATASAQSKGEEVMSIEARQEGPVGHYVVDVAFPSDGVWEWQIRVPTFYVQDSPSGNDAAVFAPITVLPAAASAQAPAQQPAPAALPEQAAPTPFGFSSAALRWAGVILLIVAAGIGLAVQRGAFGRRAVESR